VANQAKSEGLFWTRKVEISLASVEHVSESAVHLLLLGLLRVL
jgi:hypothetical protein